MDEDDAGLVIDVSYDFFFFLEMVNMTIMSYDYFFINATENYLSQ